MKYLQTSHLLVFSLLLSVNAYAFKETKVTALDAMLMNFGWVCNTQFNTYIEFENAMGFGYWRGKRKTQQLADQLVADTTQACLDVEQPLKDALNFMKENWFKACRSVGCFPNYSSNTHDGESSCWGGDITVVNKDNDAYSCEYRVYGGKVEPKPLAEQGTDEECYQGGTDENTPGYSSGTVNIPSVDVTPQVYMRLDCQAPDFNGVFEEFSMKEDEDKKDDDKDKVAEPMEIK